METGLTFAKDERRRQNDRIVLRECPADPADLGRMELSEDDIHVWHAKLELHFTDLDRVSFLSADERQRIERFHFDKDRNSFRFCRSMLRMLLMSYLGTPPAELCFAYSAHGKPSLAAPSGNLEFNISHSAGMALFAFCQRRKIGVDVERIRQDLNVQEIAERFFSAAERRELARFSESSRYEAFFTCWTRKEAFVKARGEGLSCPLDSFDVSVQPEQERVSLDIRRNLSESRGWRLYSLNCFAEHAAAVAVETSHE
jgi:4'-phosphopantetheinyl transferase